MGDMNAVRKSKFCVCRQTLPKNPTNVADIHLMLNEIDTITSKGEEFLFNNDKLLLIMKI